VSTGLAAINLDLIEDAANILAWRGWWEPGDEDSFVPDELVTELIEAARAPCEVCSTPEGVCSTPDEVADHFLARKQEEWERSWPAWACNCGHVYKLLNEEFFEVADNGFHGPFCAGMAGEQDCPHPSCASILLGGHLPGDRAGCIRRGSKNRVKHSDACRGCGCKFADTIADQLNPQQALF